MFKLRIRCGFGWNQVKLAKITITALIISITMPDKSVASPFITFEMAFFTLVNVYVDLLVFTHIAGT